MIRRLFLLFILILNIVKGYSPEAIMQRIEQIKYDKTEFKLTSWFDGVFNKKGDLWLTWTVHDKPKPDMEYMNQQLKGEMTQETLFSYWFIQKFSSKGKPIFSSVEVAKRRIREGISARLNLGIMDDVYALPGVYNYRFVRVDGKGKLYISDSTFSGHFENMFIDTKGMMYVFSYARPEFKCSKFNIQKPLPVILNEKDMPRDDKNYLIYNSNFRYNTPSTDCVIFGKLPRWAGPPYNKYAPWLDTTRLNFYRVSLPDIEIIDSFSFRIEDALYKKIIGCKLVESILLEGKDDTLLLFIPSRDDSEKLMDLIYVCKLTKDGLPIKSNEVNEEKVKDYFEAPKGIYQKIFFRGYHFGKSEREGPDGIMIYGFDKSGNMYYYVWDKSDEYWKKK